MRVLVVAPAVPPPPGGLQVLALDTFRSLAEHCDAWLVSSSDNTEARPDATIVASGRGASLRLMRSTASAIRRCRPDLVHSMSWRVAVPIALAAPRLPNIVHAAGSELLAVSKATRPLRDLVLERAAAVVAISHRTAEVVAELSGRSSLVIHPGVDPPPPRSPRPRAARRHDFRVLSVGALYEHKQHASLIRATTEARGRGVPISLEIHGDGPERSALTALVASEGLQDVVRIRGRTSDAEVTAAYESADVFSLLSADVGNLFEGFGIVFREAAGYSLPCVAGSGGGVADAVLDGTTGVLVDSFMGAADAFERLWNDEEFFQRQATAARELAERSSNARRAAELICLSRKVIR